LRPSFVQSYSSEFTSKAGAALDVAPALLLLIDMMRRGPDQKQILIGGVKHVALQRHETMKKPGSAGIHACVQSRLTALPAGMDARAPRSEDV